MVLIVCYTLYVDDIPYIVHAKNVTATDMEGSSDEAKELRKRYGGRIGSQGSDESRSRYMMIRGDADNDDDQLGD